MEVNWLQLIVNGIQLGAIYSLVALGLTLIFSIMNVINFAHGEIYMLGGFTGYYIYYKLLVMQLKFPNYLAYFITFIIILIVFSVLGFFLEKSIFRPFRGNLLAGLLISVGLGEIFQMGAALSFGPETKGIPPTFTGTLSLFNASLSYQRIAIIVIGALLIVCLHFFLARTKIGLAMRAISQDREAAQSLGMNYGLTSSLGFAIGCVLAGFAGILVIPASYIDPFVGGGYLMKAFIIIIIGGMGSLPGCILGGFIIGFIESFGSYFFALSTATVVSFIIVIAFLILRPRGLLGHAED